MFESWLKTHYLMFTYYLGLLISFWHKPGTETSRIRQITTGTLPISHYNVLRSIQKY